MTDGYAEVVERRAELADGRVLAWTELGPPDGVPLLRLPGTPGCRWTGLRADRSVWQQRNLRVVTTERPGFGASTRMSRHTFTSHADDLAVLLDRAGIDRAHVWAVNGGAPHALALAARHPDRVRAIAIVNGAPPRPVGVAADRDELTRVLTPLADAMRADPIAAVQAVLASASEEDRQAMTDPAWQQAFLRAARESLAQGAAGWIDEAVLLNTSWRELDAQRVPVPVTWFHPVTDAQLAAVEQFVAALPDGRVGGLPEAGTVATLRREPAMLDELFSR
jgi:pimeloyl-ACP methyl ester carboxylesterase